MFGGVVGVIFVLIGVFVVIPTFGPFGILWTLFAVAITGMNLYQAFGKGYVGPEIHIEEDDEGTCETPAPVGGVSAQDRLTELRALYDQRLITQEEYEEKRREILKDL
ncbi:MAG: SHOCT domain-containing protein [Oscillospiraceae bacterium]|nr:SHOCT domain-containing protein [Oscillospiraceae bacterium]